MFDFFISHTGADNAWAEWIAWQLEDAGFSTQLDLWDFGPGHHFTQRMQEAHAETSRTIAVVSDNYFQSDYAQLEWDARIVEDRRGTDQRLIPVVVKKCSPPGLWRPIIHLNLTERDENTAREMLLGALPAQPLIPPGNVRSQLRRRKPATPPPFPSTSTIHVTPKDYSRLIELPEAEQFKSSDNELYSIAFSPDNRWLAAGSEKRVLLWDRADPKSPMLLKRHKSFVYSVAFSADSKVLATGCEDHFVRLWDVETQTLIWEQNNHDDAVYSVAISRDGSLLVSGSYDRSVKVWDVNTGQLRFSYGRHGNIGRVTSVAYAPDGKTIAFGSLDNTVRLWELGKDEAQLLCEHSSSVEAIAFSPNGKLLASGGLDKHIRVSEIATREKKWQGLLHQYLVRSVAFSPDGATLASAGWDKMVYLWDAETGAAIKELPFDLRKPWHKDWIWSVAFSPDGSALASSGSDGKVIMWQVDAASKT